MIEFFTRYKDTLQSFLDQPSLEPTFLGNMLSEYVVAGVVLIATVVLFKFVQWGVLKRLEVLAKRTSTDLDDTLVQVVKSLRPAFYYVVALYVALLTLSFSERVQGVLDGLLMVVVAYQVVIGLHILIDYTFQKKAERDGKDAKKAFRFLSNFVKWSLWIVAILTVASNFGLNITSLVAGLGIGGIAVALALQNILTDLFSSFAIYFDKPFEVGDFITVGDHSGTVEKIGIKTTRLRALQGEEIVISNKELTSARIQNLKKMKERRATFSFGVLYETPLEKVKAIPALVEKIIVGMGKERVRFDRVHFKKLGDSSLDFEVVFFVPTREYLDFMNLQQDINFALMEQFKKENIEFAYPTQTVHMVK